MPTAWNNDTRPLAFHTDTTSGSASTWVAFIPPDWARVVTVQNRDATNPIRWANIGTPEAGFAGEDYVEILAGESRTFPWTAGQERPRTPASPSTQSAAGVVIGSTSMSVPISLVARESREL